MKRKGDFDAYLRTKGKNQQWIALNIYHILTEKGRMTEGELWSYLKGSVVKEKNKTSYIRVAKELSSVDWRIIKREEKIISPKRGRKKKYNVFYSIPEIGKEIEKKRYVKAELCRIFDKKIISLFYSPRNIYDIVSSPETGLSITLYGVARNGKEISPKVKRLIKTTFPSLMKKIGRDISACSIVAHNIDVLSFIPPYIIQKIPPKTKKIFQQKLEKKLSEELQYTWKKPEYDWEKPMWKIIEERIVKEAERLVEGKRRHSKQQVTKK